MVGAGSFQFLEKYGDRTITCNPQVLARIGVERNKCFLKIEEYNVLCIPFQFGFKRALFLATLSPQELIFFQKYVNTIIGLSIAFSPPGRTPGKFLLHGNLNSLGQMKGREKVGVFVIDFKAIPDELIIILGGFLETQDRLQDQFEEYGTMLIKMTPPVAKKLGYTAESVITQAGKEARKIQILTLTSKSIEHMESPGSPVRNPGTPVAYEVVLKNTRLVLAGTVATSNVLSQGMVRTVSNLSFSPELVEIIHDHWYTIQNPVKTAK
jgi:hypothetical protein